jgi:hypothetical protein
LKLKAEKGGAACSISKAKLPQNLPILVLNVSDKICAGIYDKDSKELKMIPVKENIAYAQLDINSRNRNIYIGNLFLCDNKDLIITLRRPSDKKFVLSVNNPTELEIEAEINSAAQVDIIPGFSKKLKVPKGKSIEIDI